jgi:hypothetical protein
MFGRFSLLPDFRFRTLKLRQTYNMVYLRPCPIMNVYFKIFAHVVHHRVGLHAV